MIVLGIDPGLHECAYAMVSYDVGVYCLEYVTMLRGKKGLKQSKAAVDMAWWLMNSDNLEFENRDAVIIEDQEITYTTSQGARPQDIRCLSLVTGALLAKYSCDNIIFPKPAEWKGQISKEVHHQRIAAKLHIDIMITKDKILPIGISSLHNGVNPGDWYHLWDAAGLAIYGIEQLLIEEQTRKVLG